MSFWGLCPCRIRPEISRDRLGSRSWEAHFPPDPSVILIHCQRVAKNSEAILPHTDGSPSPPHQIP